MSFCRVGAASTDNNISFRVKYNPSGRLMFPDAGQNGGSSAGWGKSLSDDRHGLMRDLNSNAVQDISDLCLTPTGVKTTRPTPLINVMFSLFLPLSLFLSFPPSSQVRLLNGRIHYVGWGGGGGG